jgi:hypothetical protein
VVDGYGSPGQNEGLASELGRHAREISISYEWEKIVEKTTALYERILSDTKPRT